MPGKPYSIRYALIPLICFLVLTPWLSRLDLEVSRLFFQGRAFLSNSFLDAIFHYAIFPAWGVVLPACLLLIISFFQPAWQKWQRAAAACILTLAIGSGLIIHAVFKENWGRPRPKQIVEFGGTESFSPFYQPRFSSSLPAKSFPAGHPSMGFYFFILIWLGRFYGSPKLVWMGWGISLCLGILLGVGRIAQGGHFLSDVLVSALIMWWSSLFCCWILLPRGRTCT